MLHFFVLSLTYKIVAVSIGVYLIVSKKKIIALSFFSIPPFYFRKSVLIIIFKLSDDRVIYVVLCFFVKSTFSIPVFIQEKLRIN